MVETYLMVDFLNRLVRVGTAGLDLDDDLHGWVRLEYEGYESVRTLHVGRFVGYRD